MSIFNILLLKQQVTRSTANVSVSAET